MDNLKDTKGALAQSLIRMGKDIKRDRAEAIVEEAEIVYRRKIEDLERDIQKLKRQRLNMLDQSPDNATSLQIAKNFKAEDFLKEDLNIGLQLRELEIKHEIVKSQYKSLFIGEETV